LEKPTESASNAYLKYSGLAIQMGLIILLGALLGKKLDAYFGTERPWFTIVFSLLAIFLALYVSLKDLITGKKDN